MQPKVVPGCQTPVKDGTVIVTGEYDKRDKTSRRPALRPELQARRPGEEGPGRHARRAAPQPPARLPGVRQGRRVQAAGLQLRVRPVRDRGWWTRRTRRRTSRNCRSKITLFTDRCIMCTRCVRFTREISGTARTAGRRPRAPRGDRRLPRPAAGEQAGRQRRRPVPGRGARLARTSCTSSASGT